VVAITAVVTLLAGCTANGEVPDAPAPSASAPSADPSAPPPTLQPEGDAAANLPYFDAVAGGLVAREPDPDGRTVVDTLVEAGFAKADMEVTPDTTPTGLEADTVEFSVRIGDSCLVGQIAASGYTGVATSVLGTGRCLVGATRTIDW